LVQFFHKRDDKNVQILIRSNDGNISKKKMQRAVFKTILNKHFKNIFIRSLLACLFFAGECFLPNSQDFFFSNKIFFEIFSYFFKNTFAEFLFCDYAESQHQTIFKLKNSLNQKTPSYFLQRNQFHETIQRTTFLLIIFFNRGDLSLISPIL
jgi:hypothetical protein